MLIYLLLLEYKHLVELLFLWWRINFSILLSPRFLYKYSGANLVV
jgi:hypothetical protein